MNALLEFDSFDGTCEALSIIYGVQESDTETFKSFVYSGYLMESGASYDVVLEGVSDIFKTIADGIKKFIERVKEFFKKVMLYITSASADLDKVADEVKKVIKDKTIDFTIDGYKFTVLDKSGPNMKEFQNIVSEYNSDMDDISKLKDAELKKKIIDWMSDNHLDKLRGEVLGTNDNILEDEYLETVRSYYRDGEKDTHDIKVDNSYVNGIISHAKKLEDTKKSSIKDRDQLVTLLSKSETFFSKSLPTMYKGNQLQANTAKIDTTNNRFSTTSNYQNVNDSSMKVLSTYATFKSRQVNKIASMINLVACERVNALRDQIKQERVILRKCLFSSNGTGEDKTDKINESVIPVFQNTGYEGRDYISYAMESSILDHRYYDQLAQRALVNEAVFLTESINTKQVHWLLEADMNSGAGKAKALIGDIIESVVATFRKKAMGDATKYKPWIDEIKDGLADKAKQKQEFKMANFADADYNGMATKITSAIKKAYSSKNYEDVSFAKDIINSFDSFDKINDDSSRTIMLNYFRTGKADEKLDQVTLTGDKLAGKVPDMIKYIEQYGSTVTKPSENISSTFKSSSEGFPVTESMITGSTYLDLIGRTVCESDIILCTDYNSIFSPVSESVGSIVTEAGDVKIGRGNAGLKGANASIGDSAKATGAAGEKDAKGNAKDAVSATGVESTDKDDANKNTNETGIGEKKTNNSAVTYKKNVDRFFKNCITLYIKAREEQFLAYINALSDIDGSRPKFDKNDKYISKANQKKEKEKDAEALKTQSK
jgi:hypothetical protein